MQRVVVRRRGSQVCTPIPAISRSSEPKWGSDRREERDISTPGGNLPEKAGDTPARPLAKTAGVGFAACRIATSRAPTPVLQLFVAPEMWDLFRGGLATLLLLITDGYALRGGHRISGTEHG